MAMIRAPASDRRQCLTTSADLDDGTHPQGVDSLNESFEHQGLKAGVEHEQIGTVSPSLMHLVRGDHEVVGQDGKIHCGSDGIQVLERASRRAGTCDHGDAGGTAGRIEAGQHRWVADSAEVGKSSRRTLDLRDDRDLGPRSQTG